MFDKIMPYPALFGNGHPSHYPVKQKMPAFRQAFQIGYGVKINSPAARFEFIITVSILWQD
jgi:hypothetical protein